MFSFEFLDFLFSEENYPVKYNDRSTWTQVQEGGGKFFIKYADFHLISLLLCGGLCFNISKGKFAEYSQVLLGFVGWMRKSLVTPYKTVFK